MSKFADKEIKAIVKELLAEFDAKVTKMNEMRKIFANFDPDIQMSILQNTNPLALEGIKNSSTSKNCIDPCYLTLSNLYWAKLYNLVVKKMDISGDLQSEFFNLYCRVNSSPFTQQPIREALANLDKQESEKDMINRLATQVGIYDSIFSFKFSESPVRTKIHGVGLSVKRKIDQCFNMIRTFEQIAKSAGLEVDECDSLLKYEEHQFDDAIKYLTDDLKYNRGEFFHVNQHLEIQYAKSATTIYVRFSDTAAEKLNRLYGH